MPEQHESVVDEGLTGPYNAEEYGRCAFGHPVNNSGRCQPLNEESTSEKDGCPREGEVVGGGD
jgi:hypothetical protein